MRYAPAAPSQRSFSCRVGVPAGKMPVYLEK